MSKLDRAHDWPASTVAAAAMLPDDSVHTTGDVHHPFALASITKLMTAMAVLVAHEEGTLDLDEPLTERGATTADLLAHSSGLGPDDRRELAAPRTRRIYSTSAYDLVAEHLSTRAMMPFADYLRLAVLEPLGMVPHELHGAAGAGARGSVDDLQRLVRAWIEPILVSAPTLDRATRPHLPQLDGVLPGFGRQTPNPWGLGPEIRGEKAPHWTAPDNAPTTFGHFGQTGTMVWVDPVARVTLIALTDEPFGEWAARAWPPFSAAVLELA